jgi:hypothetical protein
MKTIVFYWMMLKGSIIPQGDNDGRKMYALKFPDNKVVDYAYKEEILNYLETGTFYYDETLGDAPKVEQLETLTSTNN